MIKFYRYRNKIISNKKWFYTYRDNFFKIELVEYEEVSLNKIPKNIIDKWIEEEKNILEESKHNLNHLMSMRYHHLKKYGDRTNLDVKNYHHHLRKRFKNK